jgi:mRNA-degrading endonuclease RelE of RelBE toxin-antitoxin system
LENFNIQITQSAIDDLDSAPNDLRKNILTDIKNLSSNPFPFGSNIKKLKGFKPPLYRLRSGGFRVLYRIGSHSITIMRVINRKELERVIKRLKLN